MTEVGVRHRPLGHQNDATVAVELPPPVRDRRGARRGHQGADEADMVRQGVEIVFEGRDRRHQIGVAVHDPRLHQRSVEWWHAQAAKKLVGIGADGFERGFDLGGEFHITSAGDGVAGGGKPEPQRRAVGAIERQETHPESDERRPRAPPVEKDRRRPAEDLVHGDDIGALAVDQVAERARLCGHRIEEDPL